MSGHWQTHDGSQHAEVTVCLGAARAVLLRSVLRQYRSLLGSMKAMVSCKGA